MSISTEFPYGPADPLDVSARNHWPTEPGLPADGPAFAPILPLPLPSRAVTQAERITQLHDAWIAAKAASLKAEAAELAAFDAFAAAVAEAKEYSDGER